MSDVKPNPCPACGKQAYGDGTYFCGTTGCLVSIYIYPLPLDFWNRLRLAPVASDETIPVRIAVVVDGNGEYGACGWDGATDLRAIEDAQSTGNLEAGFRVTFVSALAYKPQPVPTMEVAGDSEAT